MMQLTRREWCRRRVIHKVFLSFRLSYSCQSLTLLTLHTAILAVFNTRATCGSILHPQFLPVVVVWAIQDHADLKIAKSAFTTRRDNLFIYNALTLIPISRGHHVTCIPFKRTRRWKLTCMERMMEGVRWISMEKQKKQRQDQWQSSGSR